MGDDLRPVPIQELKLLAEGRHWSINQPLPPLESLTPVRADVSAVYRGNVLEVEGNGTTIVTLCCDRCLQHFNHTLNFTTRELLWLGEGARAHGLDEEVVLNAEGAVLDLEPDALTESLDPRGDFDPAHWTFEQLSLQLPLVNRCGSDCPGPPTWSSDPEGGDPRWAALRTLKP